MEWGAPCHWAPGKLEGGLGSVWGTPCSRALIDGPPRYPLCEVSDSKLHERCGLWDQKLHMLGIWSLLFWAYVVEDTLG